MGGLSCDDFYPRSPCGERRWIHHARPAASSISIHALLAESDVDEITYQRQIDQFLSTLSLRRATCIIDIINNIIDNFYPRSPCGERRVHYDNYNLHCVISIHALLAESDTDDLFFLSGRSNFYPRSPCGERRAPRFTPAPSRNFYPRSPCGERQATNGLADTPPQISIHALLAESDICVCWTVQNRL